MTTCVDDCDLNAAKPLRRAHMEGGANPICCERPNSNAEISWSCARSLGWYLLVLWSSSHSERLHSEDHGRCCETRFWSDSCLYHCWTVRHTAWSQVNCQNNRAILECASLSEVCCSCRAAHVSIFPSLSHGSQDLSHAGASGLEGKSGTFSFFVAHSAE